MLCTDGKCAMFVFRLRIFISRRWSPPVGHPSWDLAKTSNMQNANINSKNSAKKNMTPSSETPEIATIQIVPTFLISKSADPDYSQGRAAPGTTAGGALAVSTLPPPLPVPPDTASEGLSRPLTDPLHSLIRRPRMPSHLGRTCFRAAVTASEALACHLTLDGPLFL